MISESIVNIENICITVAFIASLIFIFSLVEMYVKYRANRRDDKE